MTTANVERRLSKLEELIGNQQSKIESQQHEIERLHAVNEIQNMMAKYAYHHANLTHKEIIPMYSKRPDTRVTWGGVGYWEGSDAAERSWGSLDGLQPHPGTLYFHPFLCHMIVIANDGQTAKGLWTDFGFESGVNRETGELQPDYCWGLYRVDFIKEDGQWKFWHCHIYRILKHPLNVPWTVKEGWDPDEKDNIAFPEGRAPDGPDNDDYPYRTDSVFLIKPDTVEPYDTWEPNNNL